MKLLGYLTLYDTAFIKYRIRRSTLWSLLEDELSKLGYMELFVIYQNKVSTKSVSNTDLRLLDI
mgnify:CR=1 FL=1